MQDPHSSEPPDIVQSDWTKTPADTFWNQTTAQHVLQVYRTDEILIDALIGFTGTGINAGECVVVIATPQHLNALSGKLRDLGIHLPTLIADDRFIPLEAERTRDKFVINGMPDAGRLEEIVYGLLYRADRRGRRVRFFGEIMALMWAEGNKTAALRLEELWTSMSNAREFSIFCGYPEAAFADNKRESIRQVCGIHGKIIDGHESQLHEVCYRNAP
ncbi:MAG: hypothetical protein K0R82_62 [Flavipsychrobacter sp.]|jgi:hypothetical protein|nr:hypothetical protein [Flavipsychrobacter sp.]